LKRPRAYAASALLLTLGLCACTSTPDVPETAPAATEKEATEGPSMEAGRVGLWTVLAQSVKHVLDETPGAAFVEAPLARGKHLDMHVIAARGPVPAPTRSADEVLIFVEGPTAILTVDETRYEVGPGTIALLPAGSRGTLAPRSATATSPPLFAIVARTVASGKRGTDTPWVADLSALDPVLLSAPRKGNAEITPIVALAERIGIFVLSFPSPSPDPNNPGKALYPTVQPQTHEHHDEALLLLSGEGNVGLGTVGHRAQTASLVLIPTDLPYYFMSDSPEGTRCLLISAPAVAGKDFKILPPPDPSELRTPPPTRVQAPANEPPPDTNRPAGAVGDVREGER
jgi:mannose-6-phosphate isomerase-like protein (cupin superfamily)